MKLLDIPSANRPVNGIVGTLTSFDGIPLRYARWPAVGRPFKGTVCLFHGRTEFIEKYYETIAELTHKGFNVATMDWRGQGLSHRRLQDRRKGHVSSFSNYEHDLRKFMTEIVLPDCRPPFFALAHSMGGAVLLHHARKSANWFDRIVLMAPMLRLAKQMGFGHSSIDFFTKFLYLCGGARSYVPFGSGKSFDEYPFAQNSLTCDRERYFRIGDWTKAHPDLAVGSPTIGWLREAMKAMQPFSTPEFAMEVHVPVLIIIAGQDTIVDSATSKQMGDRLRAGKAIIIPEARHEILMEKSSVREQFWAAFDAFIPGTPAFDDPATRNKIRPSHMAGPTEV